MKDPYLLEIQSHIDAAQIRVQLLDRMEVWTESESLLLSLINDTKKLMELLVDAQGASNTVANLANKRSERIELLENMLRDAGIDVPAYPERIKR